MVAAACAIVHFSLYIVVSHQICRSREDIIIVIIIIMVASYNTTSYYAIQ